MASMAASALSNMCTSQSGTAARIFCGQSGCALGGTMIILKPMLFLLLWRDCVGAGPQALPSLSRSPLSLLYHSTGLSARYADSGTGLTEASGTAERNGRRTRRGEGAPHGRNGGCVLPRMVDTRWHQGC